MHPGRPRRQVCVQEGFPKKTPFLYYRITGASPDTVDDKPLARSEVCDVSMQVSSVQVCPSVY
jgi:hypothetical protein